MRKKIALCFAAWVFAGTYNNAVAEALPKSGIIKLQSVNRGTSMTKFNDEYTHGTVTGATFNETNKGPLHLGKSNCSYSIFSHQELMKAIGFCSFEDKDGDNLFLQYSGTSNTKGEWNGTNEILGGTGKFQKIQGQGPYACTNTDKNSEFPCTTTLEYRLP